MCERSEAKRRRKWGAEMMRKRLRGGERRDREWGREGERGEERRWRGGGRKERMVEDMRWKDRDTGYVDKVRMRYE